MASGGMNATAKRRIIALERSTARRRRLDESLRAALAAQRDEHTALEAARDAKARQVEHEAGVLQHYEDRIDALMTGTEAFSLNDLNGCRTYADIVAERLRASEAHLAQAEHAVQASLDAIAKTQRDIALNLGRIDLCDDRVRQIHRQQEEAAAIAGDDEAEEIALARRFQDRRANA
ncbi:type III secretion protein HrpB7 [Trinickia violacea]|uniref:Type III secretion protein HrpB7 n=2 Tax=Trinickia violacea TaxID=2571746 RepID=A0A4P8IV59_9BURK|nr:type III secretion protein HrpB7 [Trinickia violacea]